MNMNTITEKEAAHLFTLYLTKKARDLWPDLKKKLKDIYGEKFVPEEEDMVASYDLALAAMAQDLQALNNLFPKDQATNLRKYVYQHLGRMEYWGEYATQEVTKYGEEFQNALNNNENPLDVIPARLLHRWLGKSIQNFDVEIKGKKTGIIDPILIDIVADVLVTQFVGTWKNIIITKDVVLVKDDVKN